MALLILSIIVVTAPEALAASSMLDNRSLVASRKQPAASDIVA